MKKIADIIGIINDIAFQTDILALSAAVEAARRRAAVEICGCRAQGAQPAQCLVGAAREIRGLIGGSDRAATRLARQ